MVDGQNDQQVSNPGRGCSKSKFRLHNNFRLPFGFRWNRLATTFNELFLGIFNSIPDILDVKLITPQFGFRLFQFGFLSAEQSFQLATLFTVTASF
jgi:hypothetical protein